MERIHVIGCGKFGQRALEFFASEMPDSNLVLIDSEAVHLDVAQTLLEKSGVKFSTSNRDAVAYIVDLLAEAESCRDDWIIPTVPFHLACAVLAEVSGRQLLQWQCKPLLPNLFTGERDELYSSLADFLCSPSCPQPRRYCFYTKVKRQVSLLRHLAGLEYWVAGRSVPSIILPSTQIGPGLGGFPLRRLVRIVDFVQNRCSGPLLFSTACRCHGVTNILAGCE
jgi:hypothetical protein